ncbi:hypothetical protein BpHYR1_046579 [Brachionus plicatilis]|uniref:Uncharacterized protein n=1 Tax=Brachionus plicatilis TaxID=10195 RepID=A0A3M7Q8W1_BRAPC|nr:hypothetical protein BpHYR1_046579 [Brachionus plicatilis]
MTLSFAQISSKLSSYNLPIIDSLALEFAHIIQKRNFNVKLNNIHIVADLLSFLKYSIKNMLVCISKSSQSNHKASAHNQH